MTLPADPKLLTITDRIVTVLKTIEEGDDFFYTPYDVLERFVHWNEAKGFPLYMVFPKNSEDPQFGGTDIYDQNVFYSIQGLLKAAMSIEKSMRDIRKAINDDSKSVEAGTLGKLTVETRIGNFDTDNGYLTLEGFRWFEITVRVNVSGDEGDI